VTLAGGGVNCAAQARCARAGNGDFDNSVMRGAFSNDGELL